MKGLRKPKDVILRNGRNLQEVLDLHKKWLEKKGGVKAVLINEDLSYSNLKCTDLRYTLLCNCDLSNCNLSNSDLGDSNLYNCNLSNSDLSNCNLFDCDLSNCDLRDSNLYNSILYDSDLFNCNLFNCNLSNCDLSFSNLRYGNLSNSNISNSNLKNCELSNSILDNVKTNKDTLYFELRCPKEGTFTGYKKARDIYGNDVIVKLQIAEDSKRSSATSEKCRCSKAKVLDIESIDGKIGYKEAYSFFDEKFIYRVGEVVSVDNFDDNRWDECTTGIHFFMTRGEAVNYLL